MAKKRIAVCLLSGGLDSTTAAYLVKKQELMDIAAISINYGQKHVKELDAAIKIAAELDVVNHEIIDISNISHLLASALTDPIGEIPEGHYADESMKVTVVPNRNAIMLSIAFGYAASIGATRVVTAVHAGDHPIYPDCRPEFIKAFEGMEFEALEGIAEITLFAPFVHIPKDEIVRIGSSLRVPYQLTWSCYKGGDLHCGVCGTCVERKEAFELAGVRDPTKYEA